MSDVAKGFGMTSLIVTARDQVTFRKDVLLHRSCPNRAIFQLMRVSEQSQVAVASLNT